MRSNLTEAAPLLGFHILVLLSTLFGDTIILIATRNEDIFRLNELLIVEIQHIAVGNLALSTVWILPMVLNIISIVGWDHWLLNPSTFVLQLRHYLMLYIFSVSLYLLAALVATKLAILMYPTKAKNGTKREAHMFCVGIWLVKLWVPICNWVSDNGDPHLIKDISIYDCSNDPTIYKENTWLRPFLATMTIILPCCIVIITAIPTLKLLFQGRKIAKRCGSQRRWRGILTVGLTASVFCLSGIPLSISLYIQNYHPNLMSASLNKWSWNLPGLNIMSNFYIYCLAIPSFRRFLSSKLKSMTDKCFAIFQKGTSREVTQEPFRATIV
jgi:hypothetical protein